MNADERVLVLSAFICVHRRPKFLFFSPVTEFRSEFVDGRHGKSGSFAFLAASPHTRARSRCQRLESWTILTTVGLSNALWRLAPRMFLPTTRRFSGLTTREFRWLSRMSSLR